MSNHNYPRIQGYRRPRGHGRGQASSDPIPAPQTLPCQDQGQAPWAQASGVAPSVAIQTPQRYSDPFFYDTQSVSYWDDSNGAIHEIPSIPPKIPARTYARSVDDLNAQQQNNPYAEIVDEGPFGKNQARYRASDALGAAPESPAHEHRAKTLEFTPYFDPEDTRNHEGLRSPRKDGFRAVFATRDAKETVCQGVTDNPGVATAKQSAGNIEDAFSTSSFDKPKVSTNSKNLFKNLMTPTKFKSKFEYSNSQRRFKETAFETMRTELKREDSLSAMAEAPSPLKASATKQSARQTLGHLSVLDEVLKIRAQEQATTLAKLEGELLESQPSDGYARNIMHAVTGRVSDATRSQSDRAISKEIKRLSTKMIPGMDIGVSDSGRWLDSSYVMDDPPPVPAKSGKRSVVLQEDSDRVTDTVRLDTRSSTSSSVYSGGASTEEDEIAQLTKAVTSLRLFQDLPSPPAERSSFQRYSAMPEGLDLSKIEAAKENPTRGSEHKRKKRTAVPNDPQAEAEVKPVKVKRSEGSGRDDQDSDKGKVNGQSSGESSETVASDGYEQISAPREADMVQNGVERRWYKGFRKI